MCALILYGRKEGRRKAGRKGVENGEGRIIIATLPSHLDQSMNEKGRRKKKWKIVSCM